MESAGFTAAGLAGLEAVLAGHVAGGGVPGLVALVARGGQVHVTVAGEGTPGSPMRRDSIFRIASMTKPVTGVAAMLLVEDGVMALDDPVSRWLPELAGQRVLRTLEAGLADTVAAEREILVEDVLSFRMGFGCIMAPGRYPVAEAEAALGLKTLGPPWPPVTLTPGEWIAALGGLPLMDQPGERWRYNTGATVAGILIERAAGMPLADVLDTRVLGPLGMADTGFYVPAGKRDRFTAMWAPGGYPGVDVPPGADGLALVDGPDGWYAAPPALPDGASGLMSTVDDLWRFAAMLARACAGERGGLLSPEAARLMLRDRTTARDKAENPWFFGDHGGWGLMMAVPAAAAARPAEVGPAGAGSSAAGPAGAGPSAAGPAGAGPAGPAASGAADGSGACDDGVPRGYGWDGGSGTSWRTDPDTGLTGILLSLRMMMSPEPPAVARDFWRAARAALA